MHRTRLAVRTAILRLHASSLETSVQLSYLLPARVTRSLRERDPQLHGVKCFTARTAYKAQDGRIYRPEEAVR